MTARTTLGGGHRTSPSAAPGGGQEDEAQRGSPRAAVQLASNFVRSFSISKAKVVRQAGDKMAPVLLRVHEKLTQIKVGGGGRGEGWWL